MKRLVIAAAVLAVSLPAWAGPKDKVAETFVDSSSVAGTPGVWDNNVVTAKLKSGKCKVQIQFKDTPAAIEGEEIICIIEADIRTTSLPPGIYGNSVVLAGTVSGGQLKMKADLSQIGCGTVGEAVAFNGDARCYRQDPVYTGADNLTNWFATCVNAPTSMGPLPPPTPGTDNLLGLCLSVNPLGGERIDPPASPLLAVQGAFQPLDL